MSKLTQLPKLPQLIRQANKNYKYVFYVALVAIVLAMFNLVGANQNPINSSNSNSAASPTSYPATTANSNTGSDSGAVLAALTASSASTPEKHITGLMVLTMGAGKNILAGGSASTNANGQVVYGDSGLKTLTSLTGILYREPTASVEVWAQDLKNRLSPVVFAQEESPTYNPGQGYNLLSPIRALWQAMTNIVYIFYIFIMVGIAFLILFRQKLSGDQAVGLFNAIPSIVISLLLVYFSYPLSAVFIDMITVGSSVVYGVLIGVDPNQTAPGAYLRGDDYQFVYNPDLGRSLSGGKTTVLDPTTDLQIDDKYVSVWHIFATSGINPSTEGVSSLVPEEVPFSDLISNIINSLTASGSIGSTLLGLVFGFAAFTAALKIFFKLLQEYVVLMVYPVAAPFIFLTAAIPGRTGQVVGNYFRRLLAASVSFILVYALFLMVIIIARSGIGVGDVTWLPPLLGYSPNAALSGQSLTNIARPLIAFSLFLGIPPLLEQIQTLITEPQQSPVGQAVVQSYKEAGSGILNLGKSALGVGQQQVLS